MQNRRQNSLALTSLFAPTTPNKTLSHLLENRLPFVEYSGYLKLLGILLYPAFGVTLFLGHFRLLLHLYLYKLYIHPTTLHSSPPLLLPHNHLRLYTRLSYDKTNEPPLPAPKNRPKTVDTTLVDWVNKTRWKPVVPTHTTIDPILLINDSSTSRHSPSSRPHMTSATRTSKWRTST